MMTVVSRLRRTMARTGFAMSDGANAAVAV